MSDLESSKDTLSATSLPESEDGQGHWNLQGWSPDRPVWTGSPPCQSFSVAGKGKGKDDERHLWPVFFNLIRERQPPAVFGEQVAAAIRYGWLDDLQKDFETKKVTPEGHVYSHLGLSGHRTKEIDSFSLPSSWPTPSTRDYKDTGETWTRVGGGKTGKKETTLYPE